MFGLVLLIAWVILFIIWIPTIIKVTKTNSNEDLLKMWILVIGMNVIGVVMKYMEA